MAKTYKGKSLRLGGGGRAKKLYAHLMRQTNMSQREAGAIIGIQGRKKYGKKKMAKWSAIGRKRSA